MTNTYKNSDSSFAQPTPSKAKSITEIVQNKEDTNLHVRMSPDAFNHLEIGLKATLGDNHGFSMNGAILAYSPPENTAYSAIQQQIVDRLTYLMSNTNELNINVAVISRDQELRLSDGNTMTLNQSGLNGATLTTRNSETQEVSGVVKVFLADQILLDNETEQQDYMKGLNALHELVGHTYLRIADPALSRQGTPTHNRTIEGFVTEIRKIYKIGPIRDEAHAKIYNEDFVKPKNKKRAKRNLPLLPELRPGDERTLNGTIEPRHKNED